MQSTGTRPTYTLTKEEAKILKSNDIRSIVFRQRPRDGAATWDAQEGIMDVALEHKFHGQKVETRHSIKCYSSIHSYDRTQDGTDTKISYQKADAVVFIYPEQSTATWPTIARHIKEGSEIRLNWTAGNNTESLNKAGLHLDELCIVIDNGTGKSHRFLFEVAVSANTTNRWFSGHID